MFRLILGFCFGLVEGSHCVSMGHGKVRERCEFFNGIIEVPICLAAFPRPNLRLLLELVLEDIVPVCVLAPPLPLPAAQHCPILPLLVRLRSHCASPQEKQCLDAILPVISTTKLRTTHSPDPFLPS